MCCNWCADTAGNWIGNGQGVCVVGGAFDFLRI